MNNNIKRLEQELLNLYEAIITYNNGQFLNLSRDDYEKWDELKTVFPSHRELVYKYTSKVHKLLKKNKLNHIPLPPFIVFPMYSPVTIGWRMGTGEGYELEWMKVIKNLSKEELTEYCSHYDYPMWWVEYNPYKDICGTRYYDMPWKNK